MSARHNSYGGVKRTGEFNGIFDAYKNNKKRELYTSWHYNKKKIIIYWKQYKQIPLESTPSSGNDYLALDAYFVAHRR